MLGNSNMRRSEVSASPSKINVEPLEMEILGSRSASFSDILKCKVDLCYIMAHKSFFAYPYGSYLLFVFLEKNTFTSIKPLRLKKEPKPHKISTSVMELSSNLALQFFQRNCKGWFDNNPEGRFWMFLMRRTSQLWKYTLIIFLIERHWDTPNKGESQDDRNFGKMHGKNDVYIKIYMIYNMYYIDCFQLRFNWKNHRL